MAERKIHPGFESHRIWPPEPGKNVESALGDVEEGFKTLISELEIDENLAKEHLAIDEKIRKELVRLYGKIKDIESKIKKRHNLENQANAYQKDYPEKTLELLHQIDEMDHDIMPQADALSREISEHCLPDVANIYKNLQLIADDVKRLRSLAMTLSSKLSSIMQIVYAATSQQQTDAMRRHIITTHPHLSGDYK